MMMMMMMMLMMMMIVSLQDGVAVNSPVINGGVHLHVNRLRP